MIDLCLALVIDWSASIPAPLGREVIAAHVAGLRDDRVRKHAEENGVAVTVVLFGDRAEVLLPWKASPAEAADALERITTAAPDGNTAAGEGVFLALEQMARGPVCERRIIDLAGDGQSNQGREMRAARDAAEAAEVRINAVMFQTERGATDPIQWARDEAITLGGFVMGATTPEQWVRAITRKLVLEVAAR